MWYLVKGNVSRDDGAALLGRAVLIASFLFCAYSIIDAVTAVTTEVSQSGPLTSE